MCSLTRYLNQVSGHICLKLIIASHFESNTSLVYAAYQPVNLLLLFEVQQRQFCISALLNLVDVRFITTKGVFFFCAIGWLAGLLGVCNRTIFTTLLLILCMHQAI
jgi:hypothetical protein